MGATFSVISPTESNGAVPVNSQDQTTRPLDVYFQQAILPFTTLAVAAVPGDQSVELASVANFVDKISVGLTSGGLGQFYFGRQVGAVAGNVVTLDTPIDQPFEIGDNAFPASRDMAVDGSVTPQIFQIGPVGTGAGGDVDLTRFLGYIQGAGAMDDSLFGDQPALTNGIVLRRKFNGGYQNLWNVKTNGELSLICASDINYTDKAPAGSTGARFRNTYSGPEKHGVVVRLLPHESLELIVQDDLRSSEVFNMMAQGHFTQD